MNDSEETVVPRHIGFILDGNRRWARMHSIPEYDGHLAGYSALREVIEGAFEQGIEYVSVYAFSIENWKRDAKEVAHLMKLPVQALTKDLKSLVKQEIRVRFLGRRDGISTKLLEAIDKVEETTRHFSKRNLAICFNYGGQQEIVDAARKCVQDGLEASQIDEDAIASRLYGIDVPPVDMVIRTSGEQRLSNFMLWRIAYSEFLFLEKFWPDMTKDDMADIIKEYSRRNRRFGG